MNTRTLSDAELDLHIADCGRQLEAVYDAGNREEAVSWRQAMYAAIAMRDERLGSQRHTEFERQLDESCDYFQVQGARDADRLAGRVSV